jgi:UDP-N-acetylglucosamine diphosphorylase/glucosamine-1-phosphate N-acetyltransferase
MVHLELVEDNAEGLYPFSILHSAWELRCGAERFIDAWIRLLNPASVSLHGRSAHIASYLTRFSLPVPVTNSDSEGQPSEMPRVAIGSSVLPSAALSALLNAQGKSKRVYVVNGRVIAAVLPHNDTIDARDIIGSAPVANDDTEIIDTTAACVDQLFMSLDMISRTISESDLSKFSMPFAPASNGNASYPGVHAIAAEQVFLGNNVRIDPFVLLDATEGPIILDSNTHIMAHSVIMGPCYIGEHSRIKAGAKIYGNTVIGEWCKIGGEVENSIVHAFSNKQHEGFLGHSHIAEWVNLGADTNTSDLKNTYAPIRITRRSQPVETGRMFLGLLCGDHTKSGINTMFTTGTVCGIHANVFGAGYAPQEIPSYAWGAIADTRRYPLKKALAVADTVMKRRGKILCAEEALLMEHEWNRITEA